MLSNSTLDPAVESACRALIVGFAHHIDHRRFRDAALLFAEDGVWDRHGERLSGPDRILAVLEERDESLVERHVIDNVLVERESDQEASAVSYLTIYRAARSGDEVPVVAGPSIIGEFHHRFRLTGAGWRIAYATTRSTFRVEARTAAQ